MPHYIHIRGRESCPFLPPTSEVIRPTHRRHKRHPESSGSHYLAYLTCAQSLWLEGKPAQAILQLNHALATELTVADVRQWPLPYRAKIWIFTHRHTGDFLGNPVRHYQHLATRVSGEMLELRSWRAWACFHLAESALPADEFPRDQRQIINEALDIPSFTTVSNKLKRIGIVGEADLILDLLT